MTPEQRIQHDITHAAQARGYEVVRLNLFQAGGSVRLSAAEAATHRRHGIDWTPGTWVLHVPLPEPSRGVPDLMLVKPGLPPLLVEVKTPDGRLSPEQRGWHARYGRCSAVCRSVEDAVVAMTQWEARYANTSAT